MPEFLVTLSRTATGVRKALSADDVGLPYEIVAEVNHGIAEDAWEGDAVGVAGIVSAMGRDAGNGRVAFDVVLLVEARDEAEARARRIPAQLLHEAGDAMTSVPHEFLDDWTVAGIAPAPAGVEMPAPAAPTP